MAKDYKEAAEEERIEEPKKKPKFKLFLMISILMAVVASGAIAGYLLITKTTHQREPVAERPVVLSIWPLDPFVVNIAETNGERYLKIVIQLEISDPRVADELGQLKPRIRDSILDLLTPKTYKDLMDLVGKQRLREDIAGRINNLLHQGKVTRVYFTEFVVQ
jgi:flagellar FliL protein